MYTVDKIAKVDGVSAVVMAAEEDMWVAGDHRVTMAQQALRLLALTDGPKVTATIDSTRDHGITLVAMRANGIAVAAALIQGHPVIKGINRMLRKAIQQRVDARASVAEELEILRHAAALRRVGVGAVTALVDGRKNAKRQSLIGNLVTKGWLRSVGFVTACDGDGHVIEPEREELGWEITADGLKAIGESDPGDTLVDGSIPEDA